MYYNKYKDGGLEIYAISIRILLLVYMNIN